MAVLNKAGENNLFVLTGQDEHSTPYGWDGMPEFIQNDNDPHQVINVRFRCEEDVRAFAKLVDQLNITNRTQGIWFPALDKKAHSLMRFTGDTAHEE